MGIDWKDQLKDEIENLRRGRDELRVQMHLGAAEVRDTWDKLEQSWDHLEGRLKRIGEVGQSSKNEIEEAAKLLIEEIKDGYRQIRKVL